MLKTFLCNPRPSKQQVRTFLDNLRPSKAMLYFYNKNKTIKGPLSDLQIAT